MRNLSRCAAFKHIQSERIIYTRTYQIVVTFTETFSKHCFDFLCIFSMADGGSYSYEFNVLKFRFFLILWSFW